MSTEIKHDLDHPCRETCSGWKQGLERGRASSFAELAKTKDLLVTEQCDLHDAKKELARLTEALREREEKLAIAVEALELAAYHHQGMHGVGNKFRAALAKIKESK